MTTMAQQIAVLTTLTPAQLRARYQDLFGEEPRTGNADWLRKRIAWRLQALAEGGLSPRAQQRAGELANDADLRVCVPQGHAILGLIEKDEDPEAEQPQQKPIPAGPRLHRPQVEQPEVIQQPRDPRLPPVGTVLTRKYKGQMLQVTVLADGFEYLGEKYPSLSAVAKQISGSHCNGFAFFKIGTSTSKQENQK